jgi:hypothetical protein
VLHHHKHGISVHLVRSLREPNPKEVIEADGSFLEENDCLIAPEWAEVQGGERPEDIRDIDEYRKEQRGKK